MISFKRVGYGVSRYMNDWVKITSELDTERFDRLS